MSFMSLHNQEEIIFSTPEWLELNTGQWLLKCRGLSSTLTPRRTSEIKTRRLWQQSNSCIFWLDQFGVRLSGRLLKAVLLETFRSTKTITSFYPGLPVNDTNSLRLLTVAGYSSDFLLQWQVTATRPADAVLEVARGPCWTAVDVVAAANSLRTAQGKIENRNTK